MNTQAQTTTGHTLAVDLEARRLRVTAGDIATVGTIPRDEVKALCRGCGCRVASWELAEPSAWAIVTHSDMAFGRPMQ